MALTPKSTVKAYKLFRVHPKHPGKLFPLFVNANEPVEMGKWQDAQVGEMTGNKVKSKIGPLAFRPGWHAGDVPVATHIGEKSDPSLTAPDMRPDNHVWAEVEMPNDVDWQTEANKRGTNAQGRVVPVKAHITDQIPKGGHYRYKTNSNMTGNWLIGGSMKVNRVLDDKEVRSINKAAGVADLPRAKPFNAKKFGFAGGGTVAPEEWKAEEHVNYMPQKEREANKEKFLSESKVKDRMYHATTKDFDRFTPSKRGSFVTPNPDFANNWVGKESGSNVMPVHVQAKNPFDFEIDSHVKHLRELAKKSFPNPRHKVHDEINNMVEPALEHDNYMYVEHPDVQKLIKQAGYDSYYANENWNKNLAIYDPRRIKSAIGNRGTYDTSNPDITKARGGRVTHAHHLEIEERPL